MDAVFMGYDEKNKIEEVYVPSVKKELEGILDFSKELITEKNMKEKKEKLKDVKYIFSTWGMLCLDKEDIEEYFPKLEAVFYGAGSVQGFARPFLENNVRVFSAWKANAVPVAEYTVAQIILANKGFYQSLKKTKENYFESRSYCMGYPGTYSVDIGIIGAGSIGRRVIELLNPYNVNIFVFDPFLSDEDATKLGVTKTSLDEIFSRCQTISNHLANNKETKNMLNKKYFDLMKKNVTFINTGRGQQVVEGDLIEALKEKEDRTALLDVTYPEPLEPGSELLLLDNVFLTPHIAGSMKNELERMAQYMLDEYKRYINNEPLKYEVTLLMLKTMA